MKKIIFFAVFTVAAITSANAQNFAAKAGFGSLSSSEGGNSVTGFSVGVSADFEMTETVDVQPEVIYSTFEGGGLLSVPLLAKYYVAKKFNLQGGPQLNYDLGEKPFEEYNAFGLGLAAGGGYDINEQFFVDARYNFELTDRFTGDSDMAEGSLKFNLLSVGVGYRF